MSEALEQTRYALVIRLPRQVEVRIEDAYLDLLSMTRSTMGYHITLLGPFTLVERSSEPFRAKTLCVCRAKSPFLVHIGGLGAFERKNSHAVYLRVRKDAPLMSLQRQLTDAVGGLVAPQPALSEGHSLGDFCPHVTLGLGLTDMELEGFRLEVSSEHSDRRDELRETFRVTELWLVEQGPNEPWRHVAAFSLGAAAGGASARQQSDWENGG